MVNYIALFRGVSPDNARLVCVTADPVVVRQLASHLLAVERQFSADPVTTAIDTGQRRALRVIRQEAQREICAGHVLPPRIEAHTRPEARREPELASGATGLESSVPRARAFSARQPTVARPARRGGGGKGISPSDSEMSLGGRGQGADLRAAGRHMGASQKRRIGANLQTGSQEFAPGGSTA